MVDFRPFRGIRYDTAMAGPLSDLICPPYDVISPAAERELLDRSDCQAIVRNVIMLARALGMETTAEGVETREQYEWLKLHGCTEAQGYYISRPMEAADAAEASGALSEWPAGEVIADNVHQLHGKVA